MPTIDRYLRWCTLRDLSRSTIYNRRCGYRRLARALGHDPLTATEDEITIWREGLGLSAGAAGVEIGLARAFFRWAFDEGLIEADPTRRLLRPRTPHYLPRPIGEDPLAYALSTARPRIRPWIALAGWAGLRACEIASLQRCDVLDYADPPLLIVRGKGGRQRVVPLGPALLVELHQAGLPSRGPVFPRADGLPGPNNAHRISGAVNRHLHAHGITESLHQLRHRYGTQMYASSADLRMVQSVMGHASPRTTSGYVAYSDRAAVAAAAALDRSLRAA